MQHKSHLPCLHDNLPCPAVSHSCTFTFLSCISIVFILKSTPIVEIKLSENDPSVYRISKLVFPTPLSPTSSILKRKSLQLITARALSRNTRRLRFTCICTYYSFPAPAMAVAKTGDFLRH